MTFESLIRRMPEIAFCVLFGAGLVLGGAAALAGIPKFVEAAVPGIAAEAAAPDGLAHGVARFAVPQGFRESRYTPQVLYPVTPSPMPEWLNQAIAEMQRGPAPALRDVRQQRPVIAICIDDLGEDLAGTDRAMALPQAVALSFLPFAEMTPSLAEAAARKGHLVLAHVPMQALGRDDPGPMTLRTGMAPDEIARRLGWSLARVPGLVGINNHEGSRFTADPAGLVPVMATLRARHLFFLDSRTGPDSKGETIARAAGVMTAGRDIFLDDDQREASVSAQLDMLAQQAKRTGVAIAIGHPHDATLRLVKEWLAKDHGVTLVPLDEAIRRKAGRETAVASR